MLSNIDSKFKKIKKSEIIELDDYVYICIDDVENISTQEYSNTIELNRESNVKALFTKMQEYWTMIALGG